MRESEAAARTVNAHPVRVSRIALALIVFAFGVSSLSAQTLSRCNFYASPTGRGDGKSPEKPFRVDSFWLRAAPGQTLCLLDGTYEDAVSMISPPAGLRGAQGSPITIRALHDGKVLLNGHGMRVPVRLHKNDWFVVEGVNACCSSGTVVWIDKSSHNVIRRTAAWDAAEGNYEIFGVHFGNHNLLEDVAGWGIARKTYQSSQGGNFTTIRRAWGRWEGSHVTGPKMVYTLAYNNYDMLVENSLGTWSGEKMKESYVLLDYHGKPYVGRLEGTYRNHDVNQPYAVFGMDALTKDKSKRANARLLGSIAYITAKDVFKAKRLVFVTKLDAVEIADTLAYIEQGSYPEVWTFGLYGLPSLETSLKLHWPPGLARSSGFQGSTSSSGGSDGVRLLARNLTSFGGAGPFIAKEWETRNILRGSAPSVYGPTENVFTATRGAKLCYRYVDGVHTREPLWPWPMNQRILDATVQSGRLPVDINATIEKLVGKIPQACLGIPTRSDP